MKDSSWFADERKRWAEVAKKHGLKLLATGTPWGNAYHSISIYSSDKGIDAWDGFSSDVLRNGTPDAWKYIEDFATDMVSQS